VKKKYATAKSQNPGFDTKMAPKSTLTNFNVIIVRNEYLQTTMLDGSLNTKYTKRTPPRRAATARTRSFLWTLLFPAVATVTTDVWLRADLISSRLSYDLTLAIINVSGAFLDGFFSAFESGDAVPSGPKTEALHLVAGDIKTFGLSAYTSWAGMVSVAASMGFVRSNVALGLIYILLCIGCGFVAHGKYSKVVAWVYGIFHFVSLTVLLPIFFQDSAVILLNTCHLQIHY
jgi:hypothetical protein